MCVAWIAIFCLSNGGAIAQGVAVGEKSPNLHLLDWAIGSVPVTEKRQTWMDVSGRAGFAAASGARDAARAGLFATASALVPTRIEAGAAQWTRIEYRVESARANAIEERWYLSVQSPSVDRLSLFWEDAQGNWQSAHAGDAIAVSSWPIPDHNPVFLLPIDIRREGDATAEVWLRTQHARVPVAFQMGFYSESALRSNRELAYFAFGAFFSAVALAFGMCGYHIVRHRDRVFMAYAAMLTVMVGLQLQLTGLAGLGLLRNAPELNDRLSFVFAEAYALMGLVFMAVACRLTWGAGGLARLVQTSLGLGTAVMVAHALVFDRLWFVVANVAMPISMALTLLVAGLAHRRGDRYAFRLGLALMPVLVGALFPLLRNQGLLPTGFLTQYGLMLGSLLEMTMLTWFLTERSAQLRENSLRERALVSTDALTGLSHEVVFLERMHSAAVRARRLHKQFGLLVMSIRNLNDIERTAGFAGVDRALVVAAAQVQAVAREIDTASRVGRDEFALLVEGPVDEAHMTDAASRIMARMLRPNASVASTKGLTVNIAFLLLPSN